MKNFREIEQLTAYLDGQLSPADAAKVDARLAQDPELTSALEDMRAARGLLRKLPSRKAPRNFTLTRQMVGLKPPLPQAFSFFRLSTAFATVLLMLTFAANSIAPRLAPAASLVSPYGIGGGGSGGGCDTCTLPTFTAEESASVAEAPMAELAPPTTETPSASEDASRMAIETPAPKEPGTGDGPAEPPASQQSEPVVPALWQYLLLGASLFSAAIAYFIRRSASRKWK